MAAVTSVDDLGLSARSRNALRRVGVHDVDQLVELTELDLLDIRNFGTGCLADVVGALYRHGLGLARTHRIGEGP